jgi:hypothetical protein
MIELVKKRKAAVCVRCHGPLAMVGVLFEGGQGCAGKALELDQIDIVGAHQEACATFQAHGRPHFSVMTSHSGYRTMQHDVPMEIVNLCLD